MDYQQLIKKADEVKQNAYAPYSHFRVGAALLTKSGKIYTGCNVENASYTPTICAESSAIVQAVSEGEQEYVAIAVISDSEDYTSPCGVCRQRIFEFGSDIEVIMANRDGEYKTYKISELLPEGFNKDSLLKG
ncbi:MAG: cytidine deaminase [Eubacteriales bacterium]